jgi:tetratricopeptide (TPR) repeat protein
MTARLYRRKSLAVAGALAAITGFTALILSTGTASARPDDKEKQTKTYERFDLKIREDFFAGLRGDRERLKRGMKIAEEALQKNPKHAEALAWHGSGLIFQAGQEFNSGKQDEGMKHWMQGLKDMDDGVKYGPDDVGVRVVRGLTLLASSRFVPEQMQKELLDRSSLDFERAYQLQKKDLDKLGIHPRGELLFALAEVSRRTGKEEKATAYLQQIIDTCKDSDWSAEAKKWLADKSQKAHNCIGCHTEQKAAAK